MNNSSLKQCHSRNPNPVNGPNPLYLKAQIGSSPNSRVRTVAPPKLALLHTLSQKQSENHYSHQPPSEQLFINTVLFQKSQIPVTGPNPLYLYAQIGSSPNSRVRAGIERGASVAGHKRLRSPDDGRSELHPWSRKRETWSTLLYSRWSVEALLKLLENAISENPYPANGPNPLYLKAQIGSSPNSRVWEAGPLIGASATTHCTKPKATANFHYSHQPPS
ncbi:hypothetical protein CEXT_344561 [Caerostris extrusa]|uniref:Uncharacterized protein n=1 Tax=Caerostris extrusa TaxID=172846 RepID=A0AAV4WAU0_CAEEX|nr:hypothetical protein CEXT_344561 [Caerostris extrusa]